MTEFLPAAQRVQAVEGQGSGTDDEDDDLDSIVVGNSAHTAKNGVETGEGDYENRANPEAVDIQSADLDVEFREERAKNHATGEDADGDLGNDEGDDGNNGENIARLGVEATLEEFGHGEYHGAHIKGDENPPKNEQAPGVKFLMREGHATGGAGTGKANDVFRTNVGGKN